MKQIKIIEQNMKEILDNSRDFVELHKKFNDILAFLSKGNTDLKNKKVKLLNILLKYPKKKILFDYSFDENSNKRNFKIGLNEAGLGLVGSYEHNLTNIDSYWARQHFFKLFKIEDFRKIFFEKAGDKIPKNLLEKLIDNLGEEEKAEEKTFLIKGIKIVIRVSVRYFDKTEEEIDIIKEESPYKSKYYFRFDDLIKFSYLIDNKTEIMEKFAEEIKLYEKSAEELKEKISEIDTELKPYEALQQI